MFHFPCTNIIVPLTEIFEGTITEPLKNSLYPQIGEGGGTCTLKWKKLWACWIGIAFRRQHLQCKHFVIR